MSDFRWDKPTYRSAKSAAICDVPGVGRLYARRVAPGVRSFMGSVNGTLQAERYDSLEKAKTHLEELARFLLNWEPDNKENKP
jgi:hypothetical protein